MQKLKLNTMRVRAILASPVDQLDANL